MTQYLVDTNVLSEAPKHRPNPGLITWLQNTDQANIYTSCLVLGEIQKGIILQMHGAKRAQSEAFLNEVKNTFIGRILNLDTETCLLWGELMAHGRRSGKTSPIVDSLLAAQCIRNKLTLVTRNTKDFEQFDGLDVFCPWSNE